MTSECVVKRTSAGDRIRVGKLDFELVIGEPVAVTSPPRSGDSSRLLPRFPVISPRPKRALGGRRHFV